MIVPVKLDIPKEYVKDVTSGAIDISKAVLRDVNSGKIVKHADLLVDNKDTAKEVIENVGVKNLGIAGLVETFNKDKKIKMPRCITEFHKKLNIYLEEANKGILNVNSIDDVLKAIDEIERLKDPNIKIDFSTKEVRELLNSVYKFTTKLNKEDKNNKIKFKAPSKNRKDKVVFLQEYLKSQRD